MPRDTLVLNDIIEVESELRNVISDQFSLIAAGGHCDLGTPIGLENPTNLGNLIAVSQVQGRQMSWKGR